MTVDTCGKKFLLTLHTALKTHRISAEVPRSSKESWCPNMAIRLAWFLAGRRCNVRHCSSSSSITSSWGDATGGGEKQGSFTSCHCPCGRSSLHR